MLMGGDDQTSVFHAGTRSGNYGHFSLGKISFAGAIFLHSSRWSHVPSYMIEDSWRFHCYIGEVRLVAPSVRSSRFRAE